MLLDACEEYMLTRATAERIMTEVRTAMASWRSLATGLGIASREADYFSSKLDSCIL
jgi:serine/threonine-protein kinase HipA